MKVLNGFLRTKGRKVKEFRDKTSGRNLSVMILIIKS